jgi:MFS transporter, DHA1 family, multidrug resistance protein
MIPLQQKNLNKTVILLGVAAAAFLGPFGQTVYTPSLVEIGRAFNATQLLVNLTISVFTAILAVSSFVVGPIADARGRRPVLIAGLCGYIVGSLICLFAPTYWLLLLGRIVQAAGISTGSVIAAAVIGDIYAPSDRVRAMSLYQLVTFLGPVLGPVIGGFVAGYLHWQAAFAVLAIGGTAVLAFNYLRLPETLCRRDGAAAGGISLAGIGRVARDKSARAILLLGFSQMYGYYVFLVFLPVLLAAHFAFSTAEKGLAFVPLTAGILVGIAITRHWLASCPSTRLLRVTSFAMAFDLLALFAILAGGVLSVAALGTVLLIFGLLLGISLPPQSTILVNLFSSDRATAMGFFNFLRFMGAAAGPLVAAVIAASVGETAVFLVTGVLLLLAAWAVSRDIHDPHESKPG